VVGRSAAKKMTGPKKTLFFFPKSPRRNAQKRDKTNTEKKSGFGLFVKTFGHKLSAKSVRCIFELPSLSNTRKRDKEIKGKGFRNGIFTKIFVWCF
jgi:hypothetical protein